MGTPNWFPRGARRWCQNQKHTKRRRTRAWPVYEVQHTSGVLAIEIGGMEAGTGFDQIVVSGTAKLAGKLIITGIDGYFPSDGAQIRVVVAGSVEGQFDQVLVTRPSGRQTYDVAMADGNLTLTAKRIYPTTFAEWQVGVFSPAELDDVTFSSAAADPDGDGLDNLLEYVFDRRPKEIDLDPVVTEFGVSEDGLVENVTLSFPWADGMTDVTHSLEWSTDLMSWMPLAGELLSRIDEGVTDSLTRRSQFDGFPGVGYVRVAVRLEN